MTQDFQKPFAAPPAIFGVALLVGAALGVVFPWPVLPLWVQLSLGPLLIGLGIQSIRLSMKEIGRAGTTYDPFDISTRLVTGGIYRYSRNPGYLGLALIQFGVACLLDSPWIAMAGIAAMSVTGHWVIRLEECKLTDAFGAPYRAYQSRVRRWL